MLAVLKGPRRKRTKLSRAWDVFLDAGISLLPIWLIVFVLAWILVSKL